MGKHIGVCESKLAAVLLAPTFLLLFVFVLYPVVTVFAYSFTDRGFASGEQKESFVGLLNYKRLFSLTVKELPPAPEGGGEFLSPSKVLPKKPLRYRGWFQFSFFGKRFVVGATSAVFYQALTSTFIFMVSCVSLETLLGLGCALLLHRNFRGRGFFRASALVPWAVPTAVACRMWQWMFTPSRVGFFNVLFERMGWGDGQIPFLSNPDWQLPVVIFIDIWKTTPFMILLLLAGLQTIPQELYEAAYVDGSSAWQRLLHITLPGIRGVLTVALIFRTLDTLRAFDLFQILYGVKRFSFSSFIYYQLLNARETGYSAAAGVVMFLAAMAIVFFYIKALRSDDQGIA